ncbi:hypothetical protein [Dehalococcoides mccartyi]|uniref:hypothetical protein n=1 Tax=Dehalococcoides mccartyi TaxID=61435 RepID=UPI0006BC578E|nr:hypothetical protein [Dehalococcoides mccartyi]BAS31230.1 hypothetical protein IBK_0155 [Dehalococcoides mccartyi IBARAKI]
MGTKSTETQADPRITKILSRMENQIAKLEDLPETVKVLDNRLSSLEEQPPEEKSDMPVSLETSGNISTSELELRDTKISELESQIALLESPEFRDNLILEWLNNLDGDSYYALGVRKGYLEEISTEKQPEAGELRDPSPDVIISQEKPADMTGWAYSKTLNCYVKLEGGMNE